MEHICSSSGGLLFSSSLNKFAYVMEEGIFLQSSLKRIYHIQEDFPGGPSGKEPTCQCWRWETQALSLGQEDSL